MDSNSAHIPLINSWIPGSTFFTLLSFITHSQSLLTQSLMPANDPVCQRHTVSSLTMFASSHTPHDSGPSMAQKRKGPASKAQAAPADISQNKGEDQAFA
jgi:hypothetical protein